MTTLTPPPLSLYIHLPWCVRKCPYCDFNSHVLRDTVPEAAYIDALLHDLDHDLAWLPQTQALSSIFIGGGTPSLFSAAALERLLSGIQQRTVWQPQIEITLEANPGTVEQARFKAYRAIGINRLSLGIQSLNDQQLMALGRIHGRGEALQAVAAAQTAGFAHINLDLMYGLPQQTLSQALMDLNEIIALKPTHISYYQLTLEPNTLFYRQPPLLPDDEQLWAMQEQGQALLAAHGYEQYEVSAYAQADHRCQHNLNYWQFGDYLGIGAGAHAKRTDPNTGQIWRVQKPKHPREFISAQQRSDYSTPQRVSEADRVFEFMLNRLRLIAACPLSEFSERTGLPVQRIVPQLQRAAARGLLRIGSDTISTTALGRQFLNEVLEMFLPE